VEKVIEKIMREQRESILKTAERNPVKATALLDFIRGLWIALGEYRSWQEMQAAINSHIPF